MIDYEKINRNIAEHPIIKCETCQEELFMRWPFTGMPSRVGRSCMCERRKKEEPEDKKLREDWDTLACQYDEYDYED